MFFFSITNKWEYKNSSYEFLNTLKSLYKYKKGECMLELLINPTKAERHPWEMFFIGAFYATLSLILVSWFLEKIRFYQNILEYLLLHFV